MTAREVEYELTMLGTSPWHFRKYLVVPNVYWGMGLNHECDLLAMSPSGYLYEIEIKVSKHDIKRDLEKRHGHYDSRIKGLWFAGPEDLHDDLMELVPDRAGVVVVRPTKSGPKICRKPKLNMRAPAMSMKDMYRLARLGTIRYWSRREEIGA